LAKGDSEETLMKKQFWIAVAAGVLLSSLVTRAEGQTVVVNHCPYVNHLNSLSCLVPDLTKTGTSSNLSAFNTTLGQVIGQLPLAAPISGFVLGFDKATGQFVPINDNLGSVLTERGNTVGRHKLFVGFTFQRFVFQTVDGIGLKTLPTVFFDQTAQVYGGSSNSLSANISQYTGIAAFGLTDRIDVSVTLPYQRVSLGAAHGLVTEFNANGTQGAAPTCPGTTTVDLTLCPQAVAGSAKGVGDLLVNVKGTVYNGERNKVAMGVEARFPTGNEYNFLGTGSYGLKPYFVYSRLGRVTPHLNLGYQWNDFSNLYINSCYFAGTCTAHSTAIPTLQLPHSLDYSFGVDAGILKRVTVVGDFVGQQYFNAPTVAPPVAAGGNVSGLPNCSGGNIGPCSNAGFRQFTASPTVLVKNRALDQNNVALGLKVNPFGRLIVSANALIRLDDGGLRPNRFVPLVGLSYRF
jgi:hypothetical protein